MNQEELRRLGEGDGFTIGSHGVTHQALSTLGTEAKRAELRASRTELEKILNCSVRHLAYPHGEYDGETVKLAKETGYTAAFCGRKPKFRFRKRRYQIPRMPVKNWSADQFAQRLHATFSG
jgi:peptidoglycan/xylan/chitin deacetylase (PgdA/CDA1 family)